MSDEVLQEFFSIGDVCQLTDLKPHVLRYWESQFRFLNPAKNRSGNRVYQRREVELIQLVKHLLYTEKYTIDGANVSFASSAALPYLQTPAASALKRATSGHSRLSLNSTLRTVAQQWVLRRWAEAGRCGVQRAALPGQSNHEDGLAIDTDNYNSYQGLLSAQGFRWFGSGDRVHFDFVGGGGRDAPGVIAFQRLWNRNHPGDRIAEDGAYGPQTSARITKSPRAGFAKGAACR